jgi:SAM-dependent methyltransferase
VPLYRDRIYPFLVAGMGDPAPIRQIRRQIIPLARGTVLEIGVGAGANVPHYDASHVDALYALEPNPGMVRRARRTARRSSLPIRFIARSDDRIPLQDETIDTAVSTFTLCTVDVLEAVLAELHRVLRPGGRLVFFELGRSPDPKVQRWQTRIEPVVRRLYAGLRLTRDIPSSIAGAGFELQRVDAGYVADVPKTLTYCWWGTAVKKENPSRIRSRRVRPARSSTCRA